MNCCELFFVCVELAIKWFSLVDLSYQPYFNPRSRSYVVYGLAIRHNRSHFNTYHLYQLLPTKKQKTSYPDFYQTRIVQLSNFLRLFLLTYVQTLRRILLNSYFPLYLYFSSLSNREIFFDYLPSKYNAGRTKNHPYFCAKNINFLLASWLDRFNRKLLFDVDSVQDSYEEQEF